MIFKINIHGKEIFTEDPDRINEIVKENHDGEVSFDPTVFKRQSHWMIYEGLGGRCIGYVSEYPDGVFPDVEMVMNNVVSR